MADDELARILAGYGQGYRNPLVDSDSADFSTANVLAGMNATKAANESAPYHALTRILLTLGGLRSFQGASKANDAVTAKRALRRAKYRFSEEPAFVVRLRNKPGALARIAEKVAKGRVNIKSAYATTAGRGSATVVLTVGSVAKARKILR